MIKTRNIIILLGLLLTFSTFQSCGTGSMASKNPRTVEEAEKQRAKDLKKKQKEAKKAQKQAEKDFWKMQSKEARKRVKKTNKKKKKEARRRR